MGTGQKQREPEVKTYKVIIGKVDTTDRNGRIYTKNAFKNAVKKFKHDKRLLLLYPYEPDEDGFVKPLGFANDVFFNSQTGELCAKVVVPSSQQQAFEALKLWGNSIGVRFNQSSGHKNDASDVNNYELSEMAFYGSSS